MMSNNNRKYYKVLILYSMHTNNKSITN